MTESHSSLFSDSVNSHDGDDSKSGSSDDSCSLSKYDSADSLRSLQMSESKRKRLRDLEASEHFIQIRLTEVFYLIKTLFLLSSCGSSVSSLQCLIKKETHNFNVFLVNLCILFIDVLEQNSVLV